MNPSIEERYKVLRPEDRELYDRLRFVEGIEGWLFIEEILELYRKVVTGKRHPAIICEIGTWFGKSASILARAALDRGEATVYCIDPFTGVGEPASQGAYSSRLDTLEGSLEERCKMNLASLGLLSAVHFLPFESTEARQRFLEEDIDGLFIDGNHSFESVMNDINLWSPLVVSGGWMALHDVGAVHVDGPRRAMLELQRYHPEWVEWKIVGEMAICRRS